MATLRRKEGYLLIENRHAPGPTPAMVEAMVAAGHTEFINPPPGVFESATITCNHCNAVIIRNPLRTRPREYCPKCDNYICDGCAYLAKTAAVHITFLERVDRAQNAAVRSLGSG